MSGPKISVYSLTGRARTIVVGQMRCEQQSLACASQTQALIKRLSSFDVGFDQQFRNIQLLMKRTGGGQEQLDRFHHFRETMRLELEELKRELQTRPPVISPKYRITEDAYAEKQAELKRQRALLQRAEKLKQALEEAALNLNSDSLQQKTGSSQKREESGTGRNKGPDIDVLKQDSAQTIKQIQHSIVSDLSEVYSFDLTDTPDVLDTSFEERKAALNQNLSELLRDDSLPRELITEIKQAIFRLQMITELQQLALFDSITVMGLYTKIDAYKQKAEREEAEFSELLARYRALCAMAGEDAKEMLFSKDAENPLVGEIERLELMLVRQQEQNYISECVNEVMEEMGYDLIGTREVKKRSGKRFRNELFTFDEGTAVNVTFSPNGQISMELGGLAHEDRVPTAEETEVLTSDMETFCGEFAEFERRLKARGVIVGDRIALSPPSAEFAAILNVDEYDIRENAQISEMDAKEKRRKSAKKKVMRRED